MSPSPSPGRPSPEARTYHCLCSTLLLATPYTLSDLPRRGPDALDRALILPLPPLRNSDPESPSPVHDPGHEGDGAVRRVQKASSINDVEAEDGTDAIREDEKQQTLPSLLLPAMRPAKKLVVVRRGDGYEKRRNWRCGRCGLGVGYEIDGVESNGNDKNDKMRVMYLFEGGLVETGEWEN